MNNQRNNPSTQGTTTGEQKSPQDTHESKQTKDNQNSIQFDVLNEDLTDCPYLKLEGVWWDWEPKPAEGKEQIEFKSNYDILKKRLITVIAYELKTRCDKNRNQPDATTFPPPFKELSELYGSAEINIPIDEYLTQLLDNARFSNLSIEPPTFIDNSDGALLAALVVMLININRFSDCSPFSYLHPLNVHRIIALSYLTAMHTLGDYVGHEDFCKIARISDLGKDDPTFLLGDKHLFSNWQEVYLCLHDNILREESMATESQQTPMNPEQKTEALPKGKDNSKLVEIDVPAIPLWNMGRSTKSGVKAFLPFSTISDKDVAEYNSVLKQLSDRDQYFRMRHPSDTSLSSPKTITFVRTSLKEIPEEQVVKEMEEREQEIAERERLALKLEEEK